MCLNDWVKWFSYRYWQLGNDYWKWEAREMLSWRQIDKQRTVTEDWSIFERAHQEKRCKIRMQFLLYWSLHKFNNMDLENQACVLRINVQKNQIKLQVPAYMLRCYLSSAFPQTLKSKDICHSQLIHSLDFINMVAINSELSCL